MSSWGEAEAESLGGYQYFVLAHRRFKSWGSGAFGKTFNVIGTSVSSSVKMGV